MLALVALLVIGVFAVLRLRVGYPRPERRLGVLGAGEAAFLTAAASTFFPAAESEEGSRLLPGEQADLPGYLDVYLHQLPRRQRLLIRALLLLFEQSTVILPARGLGGFRRFSAMTPAQREAVMRSWAESRLYLRRVAFSALKAVLVLGYLGDARNLAALGLTPWQIESPVVEADLLYPAIGEAPESIAFTLEALPAPGDERAAAPPLRAPGGPA